MNMTIAHFILLYLATSDCNHFPKKCSVLSDSSGDNIIAAMDHFIGFQDAHFFKR